VKRVICENLKLLQETLTTSEQKELCAEILSQARKMHERLVEYHNAVTEFRNYEDVQRWRAGSGYNPKD
jgi:hypothetical protein